MDESLFRRDYVLTARRPSVVNLHRGGATDSNRPFLGSSLLYLLRIPFRKKSTAAFRCRSAVSGSVAMP
jgi:hypothetical protein